MFDITPLVRAQAKAGRKSHGVLLRFLSEDFSAGAERVTPTTSASVARELVSGKTGDLFSWS